MVDFIGSLRPASDGCEQWTLAEARTEARDRTWCRLAIALEIGPQDLQLDWEQREEAVEEWNQK